MGEAPLVGIIMGSRSDWETMRHTAEMLAALGVPCETKVVSAHRTPERLYDYARSAAGRGLKVIVAGAGGAAHLPGMAASMTQLPVLGVPVESQALSGMDSLLSIVQMPAGVPVGTLAIGRAGAVNAGLLAASILATSDAALAERLAAWRQAQTEAVAETPNDDRRMTVPPGSTIGIIGGGQLGRMLAMAAAQLGYRTHVYAPDADSIAAEVAGDFTQGAFDDAAAIARFAAGVDVVTYEFENIPTAPLAGLERLHPPVRALEIAQDRLAEKQFVASLGGRPAPFAAVDGRAGLDAALAEVGTPAVLKTRRFGYDGKGQARIMAPDEAESAWADIGGAPSVLEGFIRFDAEFSILLCRAADGETVFWSAPRNVHKDGILDTSTVPAGPALDAAVAKGRALAARIAKALDFVGVMAVEYFALDDVAIFNEMAPRVHNSGHWTIEGATTSQFENHIRAVCGLPLGSTARTAPRVEMRNLIGADADGWREIIADPAAHLHLYGKEVRPGRKMGHVTRLLQND